MHRKDQRGFPRIRLEVVDSGHMTGGVKNPKFRTMDANEAVASVAYRCSETIAIYPITPSSPMAEWCDEWSAREQLNLWGDVPAVVQMQSEGGVAGAIHAMLMTGSLSTTFTASQGLLLMIPNMYKIAGELIPFCMHVTARTIATHALSIFGDHSDVMACRQTGFAMLCSNSVVEAQDMACIAHAATLQGRIPFLHFFDGFRTSHEIQKIEPLDDYVVRSMIDDDAIAACRSRALTPDAPTLRGTAQNPDVFFQAREASNSYYDVLPGIVSDVMRRFGEMTGRHYGVVDYFGHPEAERVIIAMGSAVETASETAEAMNLLGDRVGVIAIRLFRPFPSAAFIAAIPATCRSIAVLDRTKEPGSVGEPLYQDVVTALAEARADRSLEIECEPIVVGGRYGLSSKEFTPAMVKAVYENLSQEIPKNHFTVGINDDVTRRSLVVDESYQIEAPDVKRAVFFGLGSDGTVGANKNSIKIIGTETDHYAQGYFVYDSKKSGAMTISHLRFGPRPIHAPYLISQADFVACHQWQFLERLPVLDIAAPGATVLLNAQYSADTVWSHLPREVQETIIAKQLRLYVIDAYRVARESRMGGRINTIMQTCFFAISGVLPREDAIEKIKGAIRKSYARKGDEVVKRNFAAVDNTLSGLHEVTVPSIAQSSVPMIPAVSFEAPDFVQRVTGMILEGRGDMLPVSAFPVDGVWPTNTARWEKRCIANEIPVWDPSICIQCNKCVLVCPHAAIRARIFEPASLADAPDAFRSIAFRSAEQPGLQYSLQVAPDDCTGCGLCVNVCPVRDKANPRHKAIDMEPVLPRLECERGNFAFFLNIPERPRFSLDPKTVKASQFLQPLFEFSGACAGCGETPYLKLLTQLFGDRLVIANATGCSSIYGGNLPTTPYAQNRDGRGPAWANSLFEDNAEFGLGMRVSIDQRSTHARQLLRQLAPSLGDELVQAFLSTDQSDESGIDMQRSLVKALREKLNASDSPAASELAGCADYLVKKSVWIVGGDGWAYDIGFGGLDHVLSCNYDVNILVLDTQVYSNTGGQQSKATPLGAVAKFAANGKENPRKQLGLIAMSYKTAYVASVAMGAKDSQTLSAMLEAESYDGPSLIVAYSHCIAHGYNLNLGMEQQKLAVDSGFWPIYRFDPRRNGGPTPAFRMDSGTPKGRVEKFLHNEARFRMLENSDPARSEALIASAERSCRAQFDQLQHMADQVADAPDQATSAPKS